MPHLVKTHEINNPRLPALPACPACLPAMQMCEMAAGAHPGKKREVEDSSRKLGALFWKLNKGGFGLAQRAEGALGWQLQVAGAGRRARLTW